MARNFFGIDDAVFFDKSKVKVIDGIAGSAKSTNADLIFKAAGIKYGRYTSTNKLRRDAQERYGGEVKTIAGGLFKTVNGRFYAEEKEPQFENIVIDEILQADPKVFEWIDHHKGSTNIVICTDHMQMLAPEKSEEVLRSFDKLIKNPGTVYITLSKTYRPRTEETEECYKVCYEMAKSGMDIYKMIKAKSRVISYDDVIYSHDDTYICHTKELERLFFETFDIAHDYTADLIPKGHIAAKDHIDINKYPIVPQESARKCKSGYLQPARVGTPTRYQGSEVKQGSKLYYLVEPGSRIEPREIYTVITRLWDIRDLIIVVVDSIKRVKPVTKFNGKPVKKVVLYVADGTEQVADGVTIEDIIGDKNRIAEDYIDKVIKNAKPEKGEAYKKGAFLYSGRLIMAEDPEEDESIRQKNAVTIQSLLHKEPELEYRYLPDIIRAFEKAQRKRFKNAPVVHDYLTGARLSGHPRSTFFFTWKTGKEVPEKDKKEYKYQLDLKSAYPHILKFSDLPINGDFLPPEKGNEDGMQDNGRIRLFISPGNELTDWGSIWTGEMVDYTRSHYDGFVYIYLGSIPKKHGSKMGDYLYERCNRSVEAKQKIKSIKYGYAERPFFYPLEYDGYGNAESYGYDESSIYQPLMISVLSTLSVIMLKVKEEVYGNFFEGFVNVDALYFDYAGDIKELGDRIKSIIPDYNFRIMENSDNSIIYQTYPDLKTEAEIKRERERERRKLKKK